MSPLERSNNLAARMGRWSARHRKQAIFGWLAFVVVSIALTIGLMGTAITAFLGRVAGKLDGLVP